jgi:universal protein Kae1
LVPLFAQYVKAGKKYLKPKHSINFKNSKLTIDYMISLGIESTAHTFGCAIVEEKEGKCIVHSNEKKAFVTDEGGMLPHKVADHHTNCCVQVFELALSKANKNINDIDLISFSQSPGIGQMLRVGCMFAKSLSKINKIPIVGVNHCIAHLEIGNALTGAKDPVMLYASGANTQVIAYEGKKYRVFGETLDIGVGNFLDAFARHVGFGFPGGPKIAELAKKGKYIELPYTVKGMDTAFSGLLTEVKKMHKQGVPIEDICYSIQETVFAELLEVTERAMAHCQKNELLLGGGVACNERLQEMAKKMCDERGAKLFVPQRQFLVDNAAMIAWFGILQKNDSTLDVTNIKIDPYLRTDDIKVTWRND